MGSKTEAEIEHMHQLMNELTGLQIYIAGMITGGTCGFIVGVLI